MTLWSELFGDENLVSRRAYVVPGVQDITVPAGATVMRVSMVGAGGATGTGGGGSDNAVFGGGAAFAHYKGSVTPGETLSVQVGDPAHTLGSVNVNGDALGDSKLTRVTGAVVLCKADRGRGTNSNSKGLASNSIGTITRDGVNGNNRTGGASGSDDADPYPLGVGGAGATAGFYGVLQHITAGPGGGGCQLYALYVAEGGSGYTVTNRAKAGKGLVVIEFFRTDPGY